MSVAAITAAWKVECEPAQKLVLLALADHANDETYKCWPSLTHICKKTGLGRSTVARCLKTLEANRIIGRSKRGTQTTMYTLNVANWCQSGTSATAGLVPERDHGSPSVGLEVVPERDGGSATVAHGTVSEPSKEPSGNHDVSSTPGSNRFAEFWDAWPSIRKRDRKKAEGIWQRRKLDRMADTIIADVRKRQAEDNQWLRGYVPLPTTYLNGDRWEDVIEPPSGEQETDDPFAGAL